MNQGQTEKEKVADQLAYYDDLIASYLGVIDRLNQPGAADDKVLIGLANESIQHCQAKRAILVSYLDTLSE